MDDTKEIISTTTTTATTTKNTTNLPLNVQSIEQSTNVTKEPNDGDYVDQLFLARRRFEAKSDLDRGQILTNVYWNTEMNFLLGYGCHMDFFRGTLRVESAILDEVAVGVTMRVANQKELDDQRKIVVHDHVQRHQIYCGNRQEDVNKKHYLPLLVQTIGISALVDIIASYTAGLVAPLQRVAEISHLLYVYGFKSRESCRNQATLITEKGVTLESMLATTKNLPVFHKIVLFMQLVDGFINWHQQNQIFGNPNPSNVFILNSIKNPNQWEIRIRALYFWIPIEFQMNEGGAETYTPIEEEPSIESNVFSVGAIGIALWNGLHPWYRSDAIHISISLNRPFEYVRTSTEVIVGGVKGVDVVKDVEGIKGSEGNVDITHNDSKINETKNHDNCEDQYVIVDKMENLFKAMCAKKKEDRPPLVQVMRRLESFFDHQTGLLASKSSVSALPDFVLPKVSIGSAPPVGSTIKSAIPVASTIPPTNHV